MSDSLVTGRELWAWRRWARSVAAPGKISEREIDWLLQSVANLDRLTLRLESIAPDRSIPISMSLDRLSALWHDRVANHQPVQYLIGTAFWRDFELVVSPAVLIPRPETESIIDIAIANANNLQKQGIWVDLGTGSGAIAIGLAKELPDAQIYAVDYSAAALKIACLNATKLDVIDSDARRLRQRITFSQGNWWSSIAHLQGRVAGMLSNPPYIPSEEVLRLQPEVVKHEPHLALDGGFDGLEAIRVLVETAPAYLQPGGIWLIEMMAGQGCAVIELLTKQGSYTDIEIINDLAGHDRFALARRN
ncbi:peptide chain release factor N(5)-glutamine methyltransferase [Chamaesiphon minutus]|uniref:Release factor glutamine methyltransferase n=1 Tax=Chamaesiphon minutus (strain ATCC 27169 / PCC 6605) TaxID=1173020 RepID=K9UPP0_CHAP6|nr:peptide chain release factor N(5)-glutamine methyltransferase [Chamaesiphon minutus]AFY96174.1 protein-(glutamine-N5) methyltransferase, release factor-specific [Chamaesiphon minutus PCC 6605]